MFESLFHHNLLLSLLLVPILYAETHYRFKYFFSWLHKPEPEIIADIPSRIHRNGIIPILIVVKDAHTYPIEILNIRVYKQAELLLRKDINQHIDSSYKEIIIRMEADLLRLGDNPIDISVQYKIRDKVKVCNNDNHRGTSHAPLHIHVTDHPLPRIANCYYGDAHCHTLYTSDQVEFGASMGAIVEMATAMELDFFCATDHSYDLDDQPDNYLLNDPDLKKWKSFWEEIDDYDKKNKNFKIVPGEEVTIRNSLNKNIHCLVYNSKKFFPGSGDGAEKWFHTRSELILPELLQQAEDNSLVFAAHPTDQPPFLQRLFIKRGSWETADGNHNGLTGLQFINDGPADSIIRGKNYWIKLLLQGKKLIGVAGNDAHGNFSRFRQIGFPFFTMRENNSHLFGIWRTGVYLNEQFTITEILKSFSYGTCFMTNGPALQFTALMGQDWYPSGGSYKNISKLRIESLSTPEYSYITKVKIFIGFFEEKKEQIYIDLEVPDNTLHHIHEIDFPEIKQEGYTRVEITTAEGYQAFSNPIWISKNNKLNI